MIEWIQRRKAWWAAMIGLGALLLGWDQWRRWRENSQDIHILAAARRYQINPGLIKAVVWRESRFNPNVRGDAGEVGLMQIGKLAAQEWSQAERTASFQHDELLDPAMNTQCGAWYLRKLLLRYGRTDSPAVYALADYNAGRAHVLRWIKGSGGTNSTLFLQQMDFPRTREYVRSILARFPRYDAQFARQSQQVRPQSQSQSQSLIRRPPYGARTGSQLTATIDTFSPRSFRDVP